MAVERIEVFDRVRVKDDAEIEMFRGKEGTVAFIGNGGVNITVEGYPDPIPLRWSEFELLDWGDLGEEE